MNWPLLGPAHVSGLALESLTEGYAAELDPSWNIKVSSFLETIAHIIDG